MATAGDEDAVMEEDIRSLSAVLVEHDGESGQCSAAPSHPGSTGSVSRPASLTGPSAASASASSYVPLLLFSPPAATSASASASARSQPAGQEDALSQDTDLDGDFMDADIPVNLENCLALNKAYQEVLDETLTELLSLLDENRSRQAELAAEAATQLLHGEQAAHQQPTETTGYSWRTFLGNYFRGSSGFGPPPNADTTAKTQQRQYVHLRRSPDWLPSERDRLYAAAVADARRRYTRQLRYKLSMVREKLRTLLAAPQPRPADVAAAQQMLRDIKRDIAEKEKVSDTEVVGDRFSDEFDWLRISRLDMDGLREPDECRQQWRFCVHPSINRQPWTAEEESQLRGMLLAREDLTTQGVPGWRAAAAELGTGRTPLQVYERHVRLEDTAKPRHFWSKDETMKLITVVNSVRQGNYIPWLQVAMLMEGRTTFQCAQRLRIIDPNIKRGRFSELEDMLLLTAVDVLKMDDWSQIAGLLPGRTLKQVRARYYHALDSALNQTNWTREEDERLVQLVKKFGSRWSRVSAELGTQRPDVFCRARFNRIQQHFIKNRGVLPGTGGLAKDFRVPPSKRQTRIRAKVNSLVADAAKKGIQGRALFSLLKSDHVKRRSYRGGLRVKAMSEYQKKKDSEFVNQMMELGALANGRSAGVKGNNVPGEGWVRQETEMYSQLWQVDWPGSEQVTQHCASETALVSEHDRAVLTELLAQPPAEPPPAFSPRQMPLLPPSFVSVAMFRQLLLLRSQLESQIIPRQKPTGRQVTAFQVKVFNSVMAAWAREVMSGQVGDRQTDTPWLQPTAHTRHRDRMATVTVEQKVGDEPTPRQVTLLVAAEETNDPVQLATRLSKQIPNITKLTVSRAPPAVTKPPAPETSETGNALTDAWKLLLARFVSAFFWPALLSFHAPSALNAIPDQPQPSPVQLIVPSTEPDDSGVPLDVLSTVRKPKRAPVRAKRRELKGKKQAVAPSVQL